MINRHLFLFGGSPPFNPELGCEFADFTKWNEKDNLLSAMEKTRALTGYGIDDDSGVYFINERPSAMMGKIRMFYK